MARLLQTDVAARRASFLTADPSYDEVRPGYADEAVRWIVGSGRRFIIDLGCGPGNLSAQLTALGHAVVGVDASRSMLRGMGAKRLAAVCGNAEAVPLRSGVADVVTAAQAFHWQVIPEMRRLLRDGGRAGLLWNLRDESVEWVRELSKIIDSQDAMAATLGGSDQFAATISRKLGYGGLFESIEHAAFGHTQELNEDRLVSLVASRSYVAILPEVERAELLSDVRWLCRDHPQLHGRDTFGLPYRTQAFRATASAS